MDLAHKQGQDDNGSIREKERLLLRLMMPVAKMFTAKVGIKSFFSIFFSWHNKVENSVYEN